MPDVLDLGSRGFSICASNQTIIECNRSFAPNEVAFYRFRCQIPSDIPPTSRGHYFSVRYMLTIGTLRPKISMNPVHIPVIIENPLGAFFPFEIPMCTNYSTALSTSLVPYNPLQPKDQVSEPPPISTNIPVLSISDFLTASQTCKEQNLTLIPPTPDTPQTIESKHIQSLLLLNDKSFHTKPHPLSDPDVQTAYLAKWNKANSPVSLLLSPSSSQTNTTSLATIRLSSATLYTSKQIHCTISLNRIPSRAYLTLSTRFEEKETFHQTKTTNIHCLWEERTDIFNAASHSFVLSLPAQTKSRVLHQFETSLISVSFMLRIVLVYIEHSPKSGESTPNNNDWVRRTDSDLQTSTNSFTVPIAVVPSQYQQTLVYPTGLMYRF
ncbi:hypothetical protein BLNAU_6419 [Blattamonas nauphoetae]|uniref:Arrestin-like N-terminal domain-containing protein n=1 Tax=Blattamonas nauphoetae TaxID=2049346 RepID=A0ABQ9Y4I8_9EUKA|nr:hypothetical protein BLNAU_6419 [Blattamonas nauphoetae]